MAKNKETASETKTESVETKEVVTQTSTPKPTIGRIVHYTLTEADVAKISDRRACPVATGQIADGREVEPGTQFPAIVTFANPQAKEIGLQVLLDGNDALWVSTAEEGLDRGTWHWPERE